jgi:hypothetical protein
METQAEELDVIRLRILKLRKGEEGGEEKWKGGLIYSNIPSYDNSIVVPKSDPMSSGMITVLSFPSLIQCHLALCNSYTGLSGQVHNITPLFRLVSSSEPPRRLLISR